MELELILDVAAILVGVWIFLTSDSAFLKWASLTLSAILFLFIVFSFMETI